jgi:manganese/zinc/iron transport system permease protein
MHAIERILVWLSLQVASLEQINAFFGSAQNTAIVLGALIALSGGMLGSFLLLRGMALTSDAISHTVLLGIVVAFMIMGAVGAIPDISSPWLLIGAAAAGVSTVVLTELLNSSGLLKQDAALGLVFPLLFALAVIFISRYVEDVHIDEDAVMVGEIGIAWANTNSHAFGDYETLVIDQNDPQAEISRRCVNCREEGISPRDPGAVFEELCTNCGEYSPAEAYRAGFSDEPPVLVFWPRSITVMLVLFLLTLGFVLLFFKELKLSTFDPGLARSLGFRPTLLLYVLMSLVSLVAVGAFEAVGSILVIGFFIIPAATAYLVTDHLGVMILLSGIIGSLSSAWGYQLARGRFLGLNLDRLVPGGWDTSISASIVVMMTMIFLATLMASPRYGLISGILRRYRRRREFNDQVILGHIYHHSGQEDQRSELEAGSLRVHVQWEQPVLDRVIQRIRSRGLVEIDEEGCFCLTEEGRKEVESFWQSGLARKAPPPRKRGQIRVSTRD